MSELQLKITIGDMDISLQGESEIVYRILKELREEGLGALYEEQAQSFFPKTNVSNTELKSTDYEEQALPEKKLSKNKKRNIKQPQLVKDLDLSGKDVDMSLKDFVAEKNPNTNIERTTVFVYYLQYILELQEITIDHVFSCYKDIGAKLPKNLQGNLNDTASSRYGYIEADNGSYTVSIVGLNLVEHDLPKKE